MDINQKLKTDNACSPRGAAMGRKSWGLTEHRTKPMMMYVQRIKLIGGGYDLGGAYWGDGSIYPLFCAWAEDIDARVFVRAKDREEAKLKIKDSFVNAKFFR